MNIFGESDKSISELLSKLKEQNSDFSQNGSFLAYLRIQLDHYEDGTIKMSEPGLKHSIIDIMGLTNANADVSSVREPLFCH